MSLTKRKSRCECEKNCVVCLVESEQSVVPTCGQQMVTSLRIISVWMSVYDQ